MSRNDGQPMFDPETHYRIELQGRIDFDWLQSFDDSAEISFGESSQMEHVTVISMHADQSGIVGLVRRLHGMGMTILRIQVVSDGDRTVNGEV